MCRRIHRFDRFNSIQNIRISQKKRTPLTPDHHLHRFLPLQCSHFFWFFSWRAQYELDYSFYILRLHRLPLQQSGTECFPLRKAPPSGRLSSGCICLALKLPHILACTHIDHSEVILHYSLRTRCIHLKMYRQSIQWSMNCIRHQNFHKNGCYICIFSYLDHMICWVGTRSSRSSQLKEPE